MDLQFHLGMLCSILSVVVSTMYNFDVEHTLHRADDGYSSAQTISSGFVFFGVRQTQLYVCHNGILSFGYVVSSWSPRPFPTSSSPLIAPFWADIDTRQGGTIYYGDLSEAQLSITSNDISLDLVPTWGFGARWDEVAAYPGTPCCNTFEATLVTDGVISLVIYNFQAIDWITGTTTPYPAQCGFDDGRRTNYWSHEWSRTEDIAHLPSDSNCGVTGRFIFRVDQTIIVPFEDLGQCILLPCYNGGICNVSAACECMSGWTGLQCEIDIDECQSSPCYQSATCVNGVGEFTCVCPHERDGITCTEDKDECQSSPCHSTATCINGDGQFTCVCPHNRKGKTCTQEVNKDEADTILNNRDIIVVITVLGLLLLLSVIVIIIFIIRRKRVTEQTLSDDRTDANVHGDIGFNANYDDVRTENSIPHHYETINNTENTSARNLHQYENVRNITDTNL